MRLTLRTLLAYLDNILDPDDAAELRRKIEESDVAKTILRRIRELLRKDRLKAPDVYAGENSLDPNTVAEYLDNTLPAEQVADFEKICLESEVELAEVAACHQILTMILGEPAEFDPKTREKMYRLPQMISQSEKPIEKIAKEMVAEIPTEESTARSGAADTEMRKQSPEPVTFATSAPRFRSWLLGLVVLLVVGVIGVGILAIFKTLRPAPPSIPQGELAQRTEQVEQAPSTAQAGLPPEQETSGKPQEIPSDVSEAAPATGGAAPEGEEGSMTMPATADKTVPLPTHQEPPIQHAASPINEEQVGRPTEEQPAPPVADMIPAPAPAITPQQDIPLPSAEMPAVPPVPEVAPLPPEPVGRIVEDVRVTPIVFQIHPDGRILQRVPLNEVLKTCDAFFVPPRYRLTIRLADSVDLVCVGPTFFELLPMDAQGQLGIGVSYGQIMMSSRQAESTDLRLKCGNIEGRINFEDFQSQVAISVVRQTICPGDPETQPVPWVIDMFSLGGAARWFDQHPRPIVLRAPVQMRLSEGELLPIPMTEQPEWVKVRVTTASILEERAMAILEHALQDREKDPLLVLREQAGARQREVAWLAQRTLAYAGEPDVIWRILGELEYRPLWPEAVTTLAELVRISPHHAAAVRAAAEKTLGASGPAAYAMLWRYPETGITLAQAQELVQQLENDSLAIRVVAFWTLRQITGMTLNYEPHASPSDRSKAVQLWRERLTKGTVRGVGSQPPQL